MDAEDSFLEIDDLRSVKSRFRACMNNVDNSVELAEGLEACAKDLARQKELRYVLWSIGDAVASLAYYPITMEFM